MTDPYECWLHAERVPAFLQGLAELLPFDVDDVLDRLLDTEVLLPIGVVVGFVTSIYIVYVKTQEQPVDSRPAATRNDTGDDAPR